MAIKLTKITIDQNYTYQLACWTLAYTSVIHCMLIKSCTVEVFEFSKDRENERLNICKKVIYMYDSPVDYDKPFPIGSAMKKIILYMIHAINVAVNDIDNIRENAIFLHTVGKRMPDNYCAERCKNYHHWSFMLWDRK